MKRDTYNIVIRLSFLIISVISCFALIGCTVIGDIDSGENEYVEDSVNKTVTESLDGGDTPIQELDSNEKENLNPLITEDMWGDVPSAEKAAQIYESYPKPDFDTCNAIGSDYLRMQTSSANWILENTEGKKLYCRGGILYGDMPYYCPVAAEGYLKENEPHVYEGGWLFVESSAEFTFIPECVDDSKLVLTKRASFDGDGADNIVWEYDPASGDMTGTMSYNDYRRAISFSVGNSKDKEALRRALGVEESVFLRDGKGVQKVVVTAASVTIYGDGASYDSLKAISQNPPEIKFE